MKAEVKELEKNATKLQLAGMVVDLREQIKELKVKMAFKDNSILALEKRGDHLKYTCENFEQQIKELENKLQSANDRISYLTT